MVNPYGRNGPAAKTKDPPAAGHFAPIAAAAWDLPRLAAFRWTTPDLTALSMALTYAMPAVLAAAESFAAMAASSFLRSVLRSVFTPRLRFVSRIALRAALIADFVFAMGLAFLARGQGLKRRRLSQGSSSEG